MYGVALAEGPADLLTALGPEVVALGGGGVRHLEPYQDALLDGLGAVHGCFTTPRDPRCASRSDLAGAAGPAQPVAHEHVLLTRDVGG